MYFFYSPIYYEYTTQALITPATGEQKFNNCKFLVDNCSGLTGRMLVWK